MAKHLIITGGAGFIGINFLNYFLPNQLDKNWDKLTFIDKLGYASNVEQYQKLTKNHNQINLPISEISSWHFQIEPLDEITILNIASESHVDRSITKPKDLFSENALLTAQLVSNLPLEQIKHFYQISTDEVYGSLKTDVHNQEKWFTEHTAYHPSNPYSASKVAQDAYLISLNTTFGLPLTIIRMANQFGRWQNTEKLLPLAISKAVNKQPIPLYGNGNNYRQWTYVEKTVKAISDIVTGKEFNKVNNTIHIADSRYLLSNNQIIQLLIKGLAKHNIEATIEYVTDRKGHDFAYALATSVEIDAYYTDMIEKYLDDTIKFYLPKETK
jgi:dTDP-glucose 4,6-dehydratase